MADILLTSESFVKSVTAVSDNIAGKYIQPSIKEAQETKLRGILGDNLTDKLKDLVRSKAINDEKYKVYKALLDRCQYYLAYCAIVDVTMSVSFKVGNFGVAKATDENMQVASSGEIAKMQFFYESKADAACIDLQNYLLDNRSSYPELSESNIHKIESNLYSAASCGIWLGGARGKRRIGR